MIMEEVSSRQAWFEEAKALFERADVDGVGALDWPAFQAHVSDVRVQALLRKMGLDVESSGAQGVFNLLDFNQDGTVSLDEFVLGIQQLHGQARSLDVAKLQHDNNSMKIQLNQLQNLCNSQFRTVLQAEHRLYAALSQCSLQLCQDADEDDEFWEEMEDAVSEMDNTETQSISCPTQLDLIPESGGELSVTSVG